MEAEWCFGRILGFFPCHGAGSARDVLDAAHGSDPHRAPPNAKIFLLFLLSGLSTSAMAGEVAACCVKLSGVHVRGWWMDGRPRVSRRCVAVT